MLGSSHVRKLSERRAKVYHAFLGVPIVRYRKVLGVLLVRQSNDRTFVAEDEAFLMAIAAQLAGLVHAETIAAGKALGRGRRDTTGILKGFKGAPGVGVGLGVLPSPAAAIDSVPDRRVEDVDAEENAFRQAMAAVQAELRASGERMAARIPAEAHAMFRVYAELLDDDHLFAETVKRIRAGSWAPGALRRTIMRHARTFQQMTDPYLRARAEDMRGLGRRVLLHLQSGKAERKEYPEQCVLVGEEISIARIADVPIAQLAGIMCTRGSPFSHAAILARTLGIPAVTGLGDAPLDQLEGRRLLVDGNQGRVFIEPAPAVLDEFQRLITHQEELVAELQTLSDLPAETPDGVRVMVFPHKGESETG